MPKKTKEMNNTIEHIKEFLSPKKEKKESKSKSKKTDKKKCISCMKCVYSCRKKARYVSNMKLNIAQKKLTKVCKSDKTAEIFM